MAITTDSFDRANSTSNLGTTDGSGTLDPLTWVQQTGTFGISSNRAYITAIGAGSRAIATVETGQADIDASLTLTTLDISGLIFRYSDLSNYWMTFTLVSTGGTYLHKRVAGVLTDIGPVAGGAHGDVMRVVANGSSIQLFRNGVSIATTTDSFNSTATKHGLYFAGGTARSDSFSVSPAVVTVTGTATIDVPFTVGGAGTGISPPVPSVPGQPFYDILVDASPSNLDIQLRNTVYAARVGGTTQTATSTSSIETYGKYEYKRTDLGLFDDAQAAEWAQTVLELYAYPQVMLADVTMQPALHDESWETWGDVLGIQAVTDLARVVWAPPDRPQHVVDTLVRVVGYKHTISRQQWEIEWQLVDAQALRYAHLIFTMGDSDRDQLDAGWVLGFTTTGGT